MNTKIQNLTPKELMISRYEAFRRGDWEYLATTSTSQTLQELQSSPILKWIKLDVLDAYENVVEFKAYYRECGVIHLLHEKSFFVFEEGAWKYSDGELFSSKIERNEPCPCGSGKKYKKCCAK